LGVRLARKVLNLCANMKILDPLNRTLPTRFRTHGEQADWLLINVLSDTNELSLATTSRGDTRIKLFLWLNLQRKLDKRC